MKADPLNPYGDNLLLSRFGPIVDPVKIVDRLLELPRMPPARIAEVPPHIRLHHLMHVRSFHTPSFQERGLYQTIDLMLRQRYSHIDPKKPGTWRGLGAGDSRRPWGPPLAAALEGLSGVGKTEACLRCLNSFPQVVEHDVFPNVVGSFKQLVWLSVDVPPSGRAADLARVLMERYRDVTGSDRFDHFLERERFNAASALSQWLQVAKSSFLGILHLDEIQNLFKLATLRQRKAEKKEDIELGVVEDQTLRWILNLTNGSIATLFSGTPDGIGALSTRLSTLQRIHTAGYHVFEPLGRKNGDTSLKDFLVALGIFQYVAVKLQIDEKLEAKVMQETAGVQRLVIALWVAAHRVAFERKDNDDLRLDDFTTAAATWLAPLRPAVDALNNGDKGQMNKYEDLVSRNTPFWADFWLKMVMPATTESGKPI